MFTMKQKKGYIEGLNVTIVGDVLHSRVARSNIWGLTKLGAKVTVCAPPMLIPEGIEKMGVRTTSDLDEAIRHADAINVLRMQFERDSAVAFPSKLEYYKQYGITTERLAKCRKDIVVMHPGPINRGVEMSSNVADGANSVILEQVTNGIAVRMAVLYLVAHAQKAAPQLPGKALSQEEGAA
jgi:aspartate carbamoyltransferase catalytic subunit